MVDAGGMLAALQSLSTIKRALTLPISDRKSPFRSFYNSFDTKCPGLKRKKNKKIIRCTHIARYLGRAIALPMTVFLYLQKTRRYKN